jgi:hypothetical protein
MLMRRWKFIGSGDAKGLIFLVVDSHRSDIIAFTELGTCRGRGFTWRGTADEFKKQFTILPAG